MKTLRLVLGDQLSHSLLKDCKKQQDIILMGEVMDEATYVKHHKKKIILIFSAMRHFANDLRQQGYQVDYITLDDPKNSGSLTQEVARAITRHQPTRLIATFPGEYRVLKNMQKWSKLFNLAVEIRQDDRFLCSPEAFSAWAGKRKQPRMEYFYREMRKKYTILIKDNAPVGGQWNYDVENRCPPKKDLIIAPTYQAKPDGITHQVISLVKKKFPDHFGEAEPFHFAVTRKQALTALKQFIAKRLAHFGDHQDAMIQNEPWMYHAHISFYLNIGLLLPLECIKAAEKAYEDKKAPLNAVEGFIRQIMGWREYIRGIYWLKMPHYAKSNFLAAQNPLPDFYWTARTKMNCLHQCVTETKQNAYAHHIQRLMVLGNFALIAGISPKAVNEWFLTVYADAYEWVELPNVSGMILFADGGYLASKPYAASGSYINKMSNYCQSCAYKINQKNGADACPFNYLYWDFLVRNRDKLASNPRIAMMYRTYDRMNKDKKEAIYLDSKQFLDSL